MANTTRRKLRRESSTEPRSVMAQMLEYDPFGDSQNSPGKPWLTGYLLPLGSVLIAALTFLTQNFQLPRWAVSLAVLYLVVVAGFSLYGPLLRLLSFAVSRSRARHLAKVAFPQLAEGVKQLGQLVAHGRVNTLLYVIQEVAQWDEIGSQSSFLDPEHVETIRSWLTYIGRRAAQCKRNDFANLCSEFSELVHQYNRFCHQRLTKLQNAIASGRLPELRLRQLKQQWNLHREAHVALVRKWENLSKTINEETGERLCLDYYEPLGTLE